MGWLKKYWFLLLMLVGVALGLAVPQWVRLVVDPFSVPYVAGTCLFLMSLGLATGDLTDAARRPGPVLLALVLSYGLAPPLGYAVGQLVALLPGPDAIWLGVLVVGCVPCTLASAAIWTKLADGNEAVALLVTLISNALVFLIAPAWLALLAPENTHAISIPVQSLAQNLFYFAGLPIFLGQIVRLPNVVSRNVARYKKVISISCRVLILIIVFKAVVKLANELEKTNAGATGLMTLLPLLALIMLGWHIVLLMLGYRLGKLFFPPADATAVAFAGSQKTLPVGLLILNQAFPDAPSAIFPLLFYHVGQLIFDTFYADRLYYTHKSKDMAPPNPQEDRD